MRKLTPALLVALALSGWAVAQTPAPTPKPAPVVPVTPVNPAPQPTPAVPLSIAGDLAVPCYGFARLELVGSYTSAGWLCFPDRTTGAKLVGSYTANYTRPDHTSGSVYVIAGPPGAYDCGVFAATPTGMQTLQFTVTVQPQPAPTPTPSPTPSPNPPPLPGPNPTPNPNPNPAPRPFPSTQLDRSSWVVAGGVLHA